MEKFTIPVPFNLNDPRDMELYFHLQGLVRRKSTGLPPPNDSLPTMEVDWHDAIKLLMRKAITGAPGYIETGVADAE